MTICIHYHPPATIECVTAFTKWFGLSPLDSDIDIQTDVAWDTGTYLSPEQHEQLLRIGGNAD